MRGRTFPIGIENEFDENVLYIYRILYSYSLIILYLINVSMYIELHGWMLIAIYMEVNSVGCII